MMDSPSHRVHSGPNPSVLGTSGQGSRHNPVVASYGLQGLAWLITACSPTDGACDPDSEP